MKAAKRKRAAAAPARTASAVTSDVAEQAAPSVATEQALPAVPVIIEDAAAEAVLVAQMPAVVVANLEVAAAPASQPVVTLDSNCTVKDAAALKQALCAVLDNEATVVIDVGAVDRIDTAAIQLLCAFVRQRAADAHGVAWRGTPSALREAAGLLGVRELLMLPADGGAAP
jgi:ABC-type transporter Mla MlaB component